MENSNKLSDMMTTALTKIREMVNVDTVVGQPLSTPDGTTIIPVSRVSFGFGAGGSDWADKNFGGGAGAGVSVTPVSFLIISEHGVRMIPVEPSSGSTVDKVVDAVPKIIDTVDGMLKKYLK